MTKPDFDDWLGFHFSRFTGCASWLQKFPGSPRFVGDPTQKSIIDGWREVMLSVEFKHCKTASQLLALGEESFPERGYDCHARTVRLIAVRLGGDDRKQQKTKWKIVDGEEVFDCGNCKDSGLVTLWNPTALKFFRKEFATTPPDDWNLWFNDARWLKLRKRGQAYETCAALCTCSVGMKKRNEAMQRFDEMKHVLFRRGDPRMAMEAFAQMPAGGSGLSEEF